MIRPFRQGCQRRLEDPTQANEFKVEPQYNGACPNRDRMIGKGKTNVRVQR